MKTKKLGKLLHMLSPEVRDSIHKNLKDQGINDVENATLARIPLSKAFERVDTERRLAIRYVSARTVDTDNEVLIPKGADLSVFRKHMQFYWNHNYSLPLMGSDEDIKADEYGVIANSIYADTGEGTLPDIAWRLVHQGHLKTSSVGLVPVKSTKPRQSDWDRVTNKLQSDWKEFDKVKATESGTTIYTQWLMLEHSDAPMPANMDAGMIAIAKSAGADDTILKQIGWDRFLDTPEDDPLQIAEEPKTIKSVPTKRHIVHINRHIRKHQPHVRVVRLPEPVIKNITQDEVRRAVQDALDLASGKI